VPRPLGALFVAGWILFLKSLLSLEIWRFLIAIISQEQGLLPIADKHEGIVGYLEFVHAVLTPALGGSNCGSFKS
jgi:hypothetical protein